MKWILITLLLASGLTTVSAQSDQDIEKELSTATLFSMGFNGFIAKETPQQLIYEKALKDNNSVKIFESEMESATGTPEGKACAACGLWQKKEIDKIKVRKEYNDLPVTLLTGDILRQESLEKVIENIRLHGCKLRRSK